MFSYLLFRGEYGTITWLFFSAPVFPKIGVLVFNFIVTSTILPPPRWALNHKQTSPSTPTTNALVRYYTAYQSIYTIYGDLA